MVLVYLIFYDKSILWLSSDAIKKEHKRDEEHLGVTNLDLSQFPISASGTGYVIKRHGAANASVSAFEWDRTQLARTINPANLLARGSSLKKEHANTPEADI